MSFPSLFDHFPVCFVSIHRDLHSAAAGSDHNIEIVIAKSFDKIFKRIYIIESGSLSDIASVEKYMDSNAANAVVFGAFNHCAKVIYMGMHVSVGEKSEEMECSVRRLYIFNKLFPALAFKHFAAFDRFRNELCALCEDLTGAERIVSNLGISHIVVAHKTDRRSVRLQKRRGIFFHKHIERRCVCIFYSISGTVGSYSHAIHYDRNDRTFYAYRFFEFFKFMFHTLFLSKTEKFHFQCLLYIQGDTLSSTHLQMRAPHDFSFDKNACFGEKIRFFQGFCPVG